MRFHPKFLLFVALSVVARPDAFQLKVQEKVAATPAEFVSKGAVNPDSIIKLKLSLKGKDTAGLEQALKEISTPGSSRYGKHLSKDEVAAFVTPAPETASAVNDWLKAHNIVGTTEGAFNDWISFSIPASQANTLIAADYRHFEHEPTGAELVRTLSYSIPAALFDSIEAVHPTTSFTPPLNKGPVFTSISTRQKRDDAPPPQDESCAATANPKCILDMYQVPATAATQSSNKLGITGFIGEYISSKDISTFLTQFRPDMNPNVTFTVQPVDGGINDENNPGFEATLDMEYAVGIANGVPIDFITVGAQNTDGDLEGFLDVANFIASQDQPPAVISTSYGFDERTLSRSIQRKLCDAYMGLAARGISLIFSSGDGGVSGSQPKSCVRNTFVPTFPSGCPYVTSVGATDDLVPNEVAAPLTGGGFSNTFPIPDFQADVVNSYIQSLGTKYAGQYNATGRGFPDVTARHNVTIDIGTESGWVAGTSCSAPIFAAIIALANDKLVAAGKPVLGYLNPLFYANPQIFNDVVTGSNPGCNSDGFPASKGWDASSGLGSVNFPALLNLIGVQ